jgi:transcriptional regulator with XRE-family HTH domain
MPDRRLSDSNANLQRLAEDCAGQLARLRAESGETQRQLAERLGMTESMISRLERGDHLPSLATLSRIAGAFGRRLDIVFHDHEHEHPDGVRHTHPHHHSASGHRHEHDVSE